LPEFNQIEAPKKTEKSTFWLFWIATIFPSSGQIEVLKNQNQSFGEI